MTRRSIDALAASGLIALSIGSRDPAWDYRSRPIDFDRDVAAVGRPEIQAVNAVDPDLRRFFARGGRLLLIGGWNDAAAPPKVAINYYNRVVATVGERQTRQSMRFFMVPGMGHGPGAGGAENFDFDALGLIEQWREKGVAPDELIVAHYRTGHAWARGSCVSIRASRCTGAARSTPKTRPASSAGRNNARFVAACLHHCRMVEPSRRMRPSELYLVRHAVAAERSDDWPDDTKRPLTTEGASRFRDAVDGLVWFGVAVDEIFTSPLVRARQTADILSARLAEHPAVKILDALAPGHDASQVVAELAKRARRRRVAIVGHEPELGELAAALLGAPRALPFKKGAVCRIDVNGLGSSRAGSLIWFLPPKILRKAAR